MTPPTKSCAWREGLLVALIVGVIAAGLCFKAPGVLQSADYVTFHQANFQFLRDAVREGRLPLWNPYIGLGRPFLAYIEDAVFYPPTYLVCLGLKPGVFLLVWLHLMIGVTGMRKLGGALGAGRWQSYFMAFCFLASGAMTVKWLMGLIFVACALCYLPWLFYHAARTEQPWDTRRIAGYSFLLAMQFLCGHPQIFWVSSIGQVLFICCRTVGFPLRDAARNLARGLMQFGAACAWCAGLTAVLLLPFLQMIRQGNRSAVTPEFVDFMRLEWSHLGSLFSPLGTSRTIVNWEMNLFLGPIALALGLAGLSQGRERNVRGLLGVAAGALLLALGGNTPGFDLFYDWLPGFASFRIHARTAVLIVFALSCAAGIWLSRPHPRLQKWCTGSFNLPPRYLMIGLILLQVLSTAFATQQFRHIYSFRSIYRCQPDYPAQWSLVETLRNAKLLEPFQPPPRVCVPPGLIPINHAMIHHYANFDAKTALFLRRPWDYLHASLGLKPSELLNTSLSTNVYLSGPVPYRDLAFVAGYASGGNTLIMATNPSPRAFIVYAAEVETNYDLLLTRIANGQNIHRCALVEAPLAAALPSAIPQSELPDGGAVIRRFDPNSLLIDVDARTNALLVLAEAWYPGWQAEIDGRVFQCVPANVWMRAVPIPAGRHQVRVFFRQERLVPGAVISLASAGLLVAVFLVKRDRSQT